MKVKVKYRGNIVEVVEFPSQTGGRVFEKARRAPGTRLIIPVEDHSVLLTKEYRQEIDGYDYRLPGGKVFDKLVEYNEFLSTGEDIIGPATDKAIEEAAQETGIFVKALEHVYTSVLGATMQWDLLYFEIIDYELSDQELEEGEDIETVRVTRDDAMELCMNGGIKEERSALILLRWLKGAL